MHENAGKPKATSSAIIINISIIFLIVGSIAFGAIGIEQLYNDSSDRQVVGGDAYNFIIYGNRGTAFVGVGIICAVLANTIATLRR